MSERYCPLRMIGGETQGCRPKCAFYDRKAGACRLVMALENLNAALAQDKQPILDISTLASRENVTNVIAFLRMTVGSNLWLDHLSGDQRQIIYDEIIRPCWSFGICDKPDGIKTPSP